MTTVARLPKQDAAALAEHEAAIEAEREGFIVPPFDPDAGLADVLTLRRAR